MKTLFIMILLSIVVCGQDSIYDDIEKDFEQKHKSLKQIEAKEQARSDSLTETPINISEFIPYKEYTNLNYVRTVNYRIKIFQDLNKTELEKSMNDWLYNNSDLEVSEITHGSIQTQKRKFDRYGVRLQEHVIVVIYREYSYDYPVYKIKIETKAPVKIK